MPNPSGIFDLALWKVTLPVGGKNKPTELAGSDLVAYSSDWMKLLPVGMQFRAPVNGVTTSGSDFPRSELRELNADGSPASWSSTDGATHTMVIDEGVTRLPNPRTSGNSAVVTGQIHDATRDISVFRVEAGKVYVTNGDDSHYAVADPAYVLGSRFRAMFVVADGTVTAYYNGRKVCSFAADFSQAFFKAGAYVQANASNSSPGDATNYGENVLYSVTVAHGAPLPGSDPTPPVVTPGVIQVIRHAEKDDNGDGVDDNPHALSVKGVLRSLAIRDQGLFITPRAGLYRPSYVFASGPAPTRMVQTAKPTVDALGLEIDDSLDSENAVDATAALLVSKANAGLNVLAVLEHSAIPGVLAAVKKLLGTTDAVATTHADADFTTGYLFVGTRYSTFQESCLPGDPGYVAPAPPADPPPVDPPPVVDPPVTVPPPVDVPPVIDPPTDPPVADPPVVQPPVVDPPTEPAPSPSADSWWAKFIGWLLSWWR